MEALDSTTLLLRARAGSKEALEALYAHCAGKLLSIIRLRMGQKLRAQVESRDIVQVTMMRGFERFTQFDGQGGSALMAWLARIAENELRDRVDHQGRQRRNSTMDVPLDDLSRELQAHVRSALSAVVR